MFRIFFDSTPKNLSALSTFEFLAQKPKGAQDRTAFRILISRLPDEENPRF